MTATAGCAVRDEYNIAGTASLVFIGTGIQVIISFLQSRSVVGAAFGFHAINFGLDNIQILSQILCNLNSTGIICSTLIFLMRKTDNCDPISFNRKNVACKFLADCNSRIHADYFTSFSGTFWGACIKENINFMSHKFAIATNITSVARRTFINIPIKTGAEQR